MRTADLSPDYAEAASLLGILLNSRVLGTGAFSFVDVRNPLAQIELHIFLTIDTLDLEKCSVVALVGVTSAKVDERALHVQPIFLPARSPHSHFVKFWTMHLGGLVSLF